MPLNINKYITRAAAKGEEEDLSSSPICLFVAAVFLVLLVFLFGNDRLFLFINQGLANPVLDFLVLKIFIPLFFLLALIPFLMLFSKQFRNLGIFSLVSGAISYGIGNLLKIIIQAPRPYDTFPTRLIGPWHVGEFSFPSTTTMLAFGLALPFLIKKPKLGFFFIVLAFLVGFTVIYTGFHFPGDVAAGIFLSLVLVYFLKIIKDKIIKKIRLDS